MYTLASNKKQLYYALQETVPTIYDTDIDGNSLYQEVDGVSTAVVVGNQEYTYSDPVQFLGNIYDTGGSIELRPYGHDYETFGAMLVMAKDEVPINDNALIWEKTEPTYLSNGKVDPDSADWRVQRVSVTINEARYSLEKVTKA